MNPPFASLVLGLVPQAESTLRFRFVQTAPRP